MSTKSITQKSMDTEQLTSLPIGNFEQISEYEQLVGSFVSMPRGEIEPIVTILDLRDLILEVRNFLKEELESVGFETNAFHKIAEIEREPKSVTDLIITIPKLDRNKKFAFLSVIGDLMRKYPNLLFDFRILKKKDIPEGYSVI